MSKVRLTGSTSGYTEIQASAVAGDNTLSLPTTTDGTLLAADSSGNVDISGEAILGNLSPRVDEGYTVQIQNSGSVSVKLQAGASDAAYLALGTTSSSLDTGFAVANADGDLRIRAGGAERARVTSSGAFLFATSDQDGIAAGTADGKYIGGSGDSGQMFSSRSATATRNHIVFTNPNGLVGTISTTSSATAYNTSSDYRLKENVVPLTGASDRVNQLQVHRFNFIADPTTTVDGFIAHEAQAVVPECVTGTKDEVDENGNPVYQGIDQSKLVPLLTAALQEALSEIADLKTRITALEAA